jgi:hypothetical protein
LLPEELALNVSVKVDCATVPSESKCVTAKLFVLLPFTHSVSVVLPVTDGDALLFPKTIPTSHSFGLVGVATTPPIDALALGAMT